MVKKYMKLRNFSFWLVIITIVVGAIVPFAAQFLFPALFKDYIPSGAEVWNQYVSIILGVVATVLSIISLVLCFRSEDRSEKSNAQMQKTFEKLDEKVVVIEKHQIALETKFDQIIPLPIPSELSNSSPSVVEVKDDKTNSENPEI